MDPAPRKTFSNLGQHKKEFVVLSLTDYSLSLEDDTSSKRFGESPLADVEIHRYPWRRSQHLEVPDSNQQQKESSYTYPVDIRLDRISRHMWWKRLLGRVARVKVYQGPITSA